MQEKLLSISIAAYNVEQYLVKTLQSLILDAEHMKVLEVIIVNDGSKDNTPQIGQEYVLKYPDTFKLINQENGGYGSTINTSLAVARGKYYKLLDGDDWYISDALSGLLDYLKDAQADLIVCPYYMVTTKTEEEVHHPDIPSQTVEINSLQLENRQFQMHGIVVKTETLRGYKHPIATHCFYTDAEYVFYCVAASKTISRYNRGVYCYRLGVTGQSVSREGMQKHYKEQFTVSERICDCYEKQRLYFSGEKKKIIDCMVNISLYCSFNYCMLLGEPQKHKMELKEFDERIKNNYPEAYRCGNGSRVIKLIRKVGFRFFPLFCKYMMFKDSRG